MYIETTDKKSNMQEGWGHCAAAERALGYEFGDKNLIRTAFTHSSYANENNCESNERLEFLGDAVLGMIVSKQLYCNNDGDEGTLTHARQNIVSTAALAAAANRLRLDNYTLKGRGFGKGKASDKQKAGLFEAAVAAIYLDGGWDKARAFVLKNTEQQDIINYKSLLSEYIQDKKLGGLEYITVDEQGKQHKKTYYVKAVAGALESGVWAGASKQSAEKLAAKELCDKIGII